MKWKLVSAPLVGKIVYTQRKKCFHLKNGRSLTRYRPSLPLTLLLISTLQVSPGLVHPMKLLSWSESVSDWFWSLEKGTDISISCETTQATLSFVCCLSVPLLSPSLLLDSGKSPLHLAQTKKIRVIWNLKYKTVVKDTFFSAGKLAPEKKSCVWRK